MHIAVVACKPPEPKVVFFICKSILCPLNSECFIALVVEEAFFFFLIRAKIASVQPCLSLNIFFFFCLSTTADAPFTVAPNVPEIMEGIYLVSELCTEHEGGELKR